MDLMRELRLIGYFGVEVKQQQPSTASTTATTTVTSLEEHDDELEEVMRGLSLSSVVLLFLSKIIQFQMIGKYIELAKVKAMKTTRDMFGETEVNKAILALEQRQGT
ncbi:UNVERIFIED_CONTAM: hypothetical protein HDU68_010841 [Siphonaria sp. JEL0065]|nr:hypothetical protein HDU68_010841 [Siphonaria sp. JEL0065]